MEPIKIKGLNPREYEHHLDRKALDAVQKVPTLDFLIEKINDYGFERLLRLEFIGSNLKVTSSSLPAVYEVLEDACEILNLKKIPELYIRGNDYFRALQFPTNNLQGITVGVRNPVIVISSESIENLSRSELLFVLGCEVGRIKSQHLLYQDIAYLLPLFSNIAGANLLAGGLDLALTQWLRMADYTADRAGLLACQDMNVAMTAMAKIAGLPKKYFDSFSIGNFITQAREFEATGAFLNENPVIQAKKLSQVDKVFERLVKVVSSAIRDQAFTIARASELLKWVDSKRYQGILERKRYCVQCEEELEPLANFCTKFGHANPYTSVD